jgi:hypothetical protein
MNSTDQVFIDSLTQIEKDTRNLFVDEYLLDMDALAAFSRMGYNKEACTMMRNSFMRDPYVLQRITEVGKDKGKCLENKKNWCNKQLIAIAQDKTINASARVSALKLFTELHSITKDEELSTIDDAIKITRLIINEKHAPTDTHTGLR